MQDSGYSKSYPSEEEGATRIFEQKEHTNVEGFLTEKECQDLYKVLLRDEHKILRYPSAPESEHTGTTTRYETYNLLRHPDVRHLRLPERLSQLPKFRHLNTLYIQCWVNILHNNQGIVGHAHALDEHGVAISGDDFLACSVYIQGPKPSYTWYEDPKTNEDRKIENIPGDLHLVGSHLFHEVKRNIHTQPRMSIAMDVYPQQSIDFWKEHLTPTEFNARFFTFLRTTV